MKLKFKLMALLMEMFIILFFITLIGGVYEYKI